MTRFDHDVARRTVIKGAGVALAAVAAATTQGTSAERSEAGEIWSSEYWAKKGDVPLWMYRKRLGAPKPGEPARPGLFFVHGSSGTSRVVDLQVPGQGAWAVNDAFAAAGFDCWTMDHENY